MKRLIAYPGLGLRLLPRGEKTVNKNMAGGKVSVASTNLRAQIVVLKQLIAAHEMTKQQLIAASRRLTGDIISLTRKTKSFSTTDKLPKNKLLNTFLFKKLYPPTTQMKTIDDLESQMRTVRYRPYIPRRVKGKNSYLGCPGCKLELPIKLGTSEGRTITKRSVAFITHCLAECSKYLALGLHANCHICQMSFITKQSYKKHVTKYHSRRVKPAWMSQQIFHTAQSGSISKTRVESCPGCNKKFAKRFYGGKHLITFEYYVHCIEKCEKYKELNLSAECFECKLKFLTTKGLQLHNVKIHRSAVDYSRHWMTKEVINSSSMGMHCNTTVNCLGCDKEFPARRARAQIRYRRDYLVHCIEECEEYKKLGLIWNCKHCDCKFLSKQSLGNHRCQATN